MGRSFEHYATAVARSTARHGTLRKSPWWLFGPGVRWRRRASTIVGAFIVGTVIATFLPTVARAASPQLVTDKADYSPSEVVHIIGSDFDPGTYALPVKRPDGSVIKGDGSSTPGWDNVTAGDGRTIAYDYQHGGLGGLYEARAYPVSWSGDWEEQPLASVTFTDAKPDSTDWTQCANKDPVEGDCKWIQGALNSGKSSYTEGSSVPQRAIFKGISTTSGNVHTLTFSHDTTKGGIHSYDFLTSFAQAEQDAAAVGAPFNDDATPGGATKLTGPVPPPASETGQACAAANSLPTECAALHDGGIFVDVDVPDDNFMSKDGSTLSRIQAYEIGMGRGNRTIRIYGNAGISSASLTLGHNVGAGGDTGDSEIDYTLTWTSASTNVMVEMAGHLAMSTPTPTTGAGWGTGLGASQVSGGPYHFNLGLFDGSKIGSQDNSIQTGAIPAPGTIIVEKQTVPDGASGSFTFSGDVAGTISDNGQLTFANIVPGQYTSTESNPGSAFALSSIVCNDANSTGNVGTRTATFNVESGETVKCTFTNTRQPGTLVVIKQVDNSNGGSKTPADFSMHVKQGATEVGGGPFPGVGGAGRSYSLPQGDYVVSEDPVPGYVGDFSQCGTNGAVSVSAGQTTTCTVTNSSQKGTLTVIKQVVGGDAVASDFTMSVAGNGPSPSSFPGSAEGTLISIGAGTYEVTESGVSGYTPSFAGDCVGSIAPGEHKTCTVTNTAQPSTLIVKKIVDNSAGGDATADQFTMTVTGAGASPSSFPGDPDGTTVDVSSNDAYQVSESGPSGYTASYSEDCVSETGIPEGQTRTCTITNTAQDSKLIVIKTVDNSAGGDATADQFEITVTGANASPAVFDGAEAPGSDVDVSSNDAYSVSESMPSGFTYFQSFSEDCASDTGIPEGQTRTCTITNTAFRPDFTIDKTGDASSKVGDDVNYTITVRNTSSSNSPDLTCSITDPLLGISKSVTLQPGEQSVTNASRTVGSGDPDLLVNTASATCVVQEGFGNVLGPKTESHVVDLFRPSVQVAKGCSPAGARIGDTVTFTCMITNTSSSDSPNLVLLSVNDTLKGDMTAAAIAAGCQNLAPGAMCVFTYSHTITASDPDPLVNSVTVRYAVDGWPNIVTASNSCSVDITNAGCTPGFWKNSPHLWDGAGTNDLPQPESTGFPQAKYTTGDRFNLVFGVTKAQSGLGDSTTLLQALGLNGGGKNALARHAAAALISAAVENSKVDYTYTVQQVLNIYRDGVNATGDFDGAGPYVNDGVDNLSVDAAHALLANANERNCPLSASTSSSSSTATSTSSTATPSASPTTTTTSSSSTSSATPTPSPTPTPTPTPSTTTSGGGGGRRG